ncbi:MAG: hypothetical protein WEB52_01550 [Dehalococcoidia bacterium]
MLYIRLSLMNPKPGKDHEVAAIMDDLVTYYKQQDGFVDGYKLRAADETGDIGRVTVWRSEEEADRTAQNTHVMSRRSDLMPLIEEGSHEERSFFAEEESKPLSQLLRKLGL